MKVSENCHNLGAQFPTQNNWFLQPEKEHINSNSTYKVRENNWITGSGYDWIPLGQRIMVKILRSEPDS